MPSDEFDILRENRKGQLTGGINYNPLDNIYAQRIAQIDAAAEASRDSIKSSTSYSTNTGYLDHVQNIALAYATNGSKYQGNQEMGDLAVEAFTKLGQNAYSVNSTKGFFWGWEFGSPTTICNTISLIYELVPQAVIDGYMAAIDKHNPDVGFTAANKMWDCQAILLRGVVGKNADKINHAVNGMKPIYRYVTSGDGYYTDGSFIQHANIAYNGGYGKSLMRELCESVGMLYGTDYEITDESLSNIYEIALNSYVPYIYRGEMMDMVRGREIGSPVSRSSHRIGHQAMQFIVRMTQFSPEPYNAQFKSIIKKWVNEDKYDSFFDTDLPVDILRLADEVCKDDDVQPADELIKSMISTNMAKAVHLRNGWGLGVSMSSKKAGFYEANDGNGTAWYTGSGMVYLYTDDMEQFADHFWTTINRYRLPGITLDTIVRSQSDGAAAYNAYNWVGGSTVDDKYSSVGMHLSQYNTTLEAKKSWFMFDDEVVCLGSGISSTDNRTIESVVDSRKLNSSGTNEIYIDGELDQRQIGTEKNIAPEWINIQGNVDNSNVGYYFPEGSNIKALRELRDGTNYGLYEIPWNYNYKESRYYMTMWYDHGANPDNQGYSYVLLPTYSADQTAEYNTNPDIEIIAKTDSIHAVKEKSLGIVAANFFSNGGSADIITSDSQSSVMVKNNNGEVEIAVSDPTMANTGIVTVEVCVPVGGLLKADSGVNIISADENSVKISVNVNKSQGKTFKATFQSAGSIYIHAYYYKATNTLVDVVTTSNADYVYIPPTKENMQEYEVRTFVWESLDSMKPIVK
ncbi:MAG: polysaccharide lyase 8 family protein [Eubacteriales bacterium]|nr:polysaccharide lyase 8 family protein [Eubacteriales bacterium]